MCIIPKICERLRYNDARERLFRPPRGTGDIVHIPRGTDKSRVIDVTDP